MEKDNFMRAMIFGGSGFIGSRVVRGLLDRKHSVVNLDIFPLIPKPIELRYNHLYCDIRDPEEVKEYVQEVVPEIVYIFSAVSSIEDCINDIRAALNVNLIGLYNILDGVTSLLDRETNKINKNSFGGINLPKVVFASSMYANSANQPYGITKFAGERLLKWYASRYGFEYVILRFGTIYGPGAGEHNGLRKLISNALKDKYISYYGTGVEEREYIHVVDVANACVDLSSESDDTFVITGMDKISGSYLCSMLWEILGEEYGIIFRGEQHEGHYDLTPYRYSDDLGKKYIPDKTIDFGSGLLELIEEVKNEKQEDI